MILVHNKIIINISYNNFTVVVVSTKIVMAVFPVPKTMSDS